MTEYCRRHVFTAEHIGGRCEGPGGCGHLIAVHIGVDHCTVCELVDLTSRQKEAPLAEQGMSPVDAELMQAMGWTWEQLTATPTYVRAFLAAPAKLKKARPSWSELNKLRTERGAPPLPTPFVGAKVHFVDGWSCTRADITDVDECDDIVVTLSLPYSEPGAARKDRVCMDLRYGYWSDNDFKSHRTGTWHWPCEGGDQTAPPEPDADAPTTITINVDGSVLRRDLCAVIEKHLINRTKRAGRP